MSGASFWLVWLVLGAAAAVGSWWAWHWAQDRGWVGSRGRVGSLRHERGMATTSQVRRHFSSKAVGRMTWLRPDLKHPTVWDLALRVGRARGFDVFVPIEDSGVVSAPARSFKSRMFVEPMMCEFPGPALGTSVRLEMAARTIAARAELGPVAVFAPGRQMDRGTLSAGKDGDLASLLAGASLRWSLTRGCEQAETALRRARALAANSGKGTGADSGFWESHARLVLAPLLHAAALSGEGVDALARWSNVPGQARDAVHVLADHPGAVPGWADTLDAEITGDPKTVQNIWKTVASCITEPLMDPHVRESVTPQPGRGLDIDEFITAQGTLYIVGNATATSAPFVAALIEDFYAVATARADRSPDVRLCPPLFQCLDEIANIAVLPSLAEMMSAGGGSGVTTVIVEQSRSQLEAKLGQATARAIWGAATWKLVLGGVVESETLNGVVTAIGDRSVERRVSTGYGLAQGSWGEAEEKVASPGQVRRLEPGTGLLIKGSAPVVLVQGMDQQERRRHPARRSLPGRSAGAVSLPGGQQQATTSYGIWPVSTTVR